MKALAKRFLPPAILHSVRMGWEDLRDWAGVFAFALAFMVGRKPFPKTLLFFGFAPGDDLLCTIVVRELRRRGRDRLLMVSDHPELFFGNPDATDVHALWRRYSQYDSTVAICRRFARICGAGLIQPEYAPPAGPDRRTVPSRHVVVEMCARAGIVGPVSIRPYLVLSDDETSAAFWARDRIVIHSSGAAARHPARNKEWFPERFQGVVDALAGEFSFIQVGSMADPLLRRATDFRGATRIRETAAILHQARLFVGLEGFLMHLARAVDCPSVIVFGGRVAPWQVGYVCNLNIYSAVPCAPCWRGNGCEFARVCMDQITVADVVSAIREMLARPRGPLAVETAEIAPPIVPDAGPPPGRVEEMLVGPP